MDDHSRNGDSTLRSSSDGSAPATSADSSTAAVSTVRNTAQDDTYAPDTAPLLSDERKLTPNSGFAAIMETVSRSRLGRLIDSLAIPSEPGLTRAQLMLSNADLKPVEPERRQWTSRNFVAFWIADSFNINTWMIASASIIDGLAWYQTWICVWVGYAIAASFVVMTGRIGATYHIPFPVVNRASFGIWGALWPVLNRTVMACIWYGVQAWIGGTCVCLMVRSIWPAWDRYGPGGPNDTLASSGTNTRDFVCFILFWLASLPFLWFPVHKLRHLFTVKAIVAPSAGVAFFIWAIVRAQGIGPIVHKPASKTGSALAWAIVKALMSAIANFATLIVNDPDFTRFARRPRDAFWSQLLTIPIGYAVTSFIGIMVSSSSTVIYGSAIWSPLDLLQKFLEDPDIGGATRFGVFVIGASFALAQLGTNIAANSVSAGTDMTALLPRYINIRRGSYICAAIGLIIMPWHFFASSNSFTTYLSAYSVFLSSIAGVMVSDYYLVRKGYLQTKDLYSAQKSGPYWYAMGFHWRGYAAYICGILINVVGFAGAVGVSVPAGATYIYNLSFFGGFIVSAAVYYLLCWWSPIPATSTHWLEAPLDDAEFEGASGNVRLAYEVVSEESDDESMVRRREGFKMAKLKQNRERIDLGRS